MNEKPSLPVLGHYIWWGLNGINVSSSDLLQHLQLQQFQQFMPEPPTAMKSLRRAIWDWVKEKYGSEYGPRGSTRELIRTINAGRTAKHIIFALVTENVDLDLLGLEYATEVRFQLEKLTPEEREKRQPTLICTTDAVGVIAAENEATRITDELRPLWSTHQDRYISSDLSVMIRQIVASMTGSVCVRSEGGVYFVPVDQHDTLLRLAALIENLPTDGQEMPYLDMIGVPDETEARRTLTRAVHRGFVSELEAMNSDLDDLRSKAKAVKPATVADRLTKYRALADRAQTYADHLGMQQAAIAEAIAQLQAKAKALILDDDDEVGSDSVAG